MKKHFYSFSVYFFIQLFLLIISLSTLRTSRISHTFTSFSDYNFTTNQDIPDTKNPQSHTEIPQIFITLKDIDKQTLDSGDKNTVYSAHITSNSKSFPLSNEFIAIHGHGNSTWTFPKKPYTIKFPNKQDYFGLGKSKTYVLLAFTLDASFLRTAVSHQLATSLNINSVMAGNFVELYIDNEYSGLYYLTKKVSATTANLKSADDVLVEIENIHEKSPDDTILTLENSDTLVFSDALDDSPENQPILLQSFASDWQKVLTFVAENNYQALTEILDVDSFAKYFLLSEFSGNLDAYQTSFYLTRKNSKISAGPVWDYDITYCAKNSPAELCDPTSFLNIYGLDWNYDYRHYSTIVFDLLRFPEFKTKVAEIYNNTIKNQKQPILDYLESNYKSIYLYATKDLATTSTTCIDETGLETKCDYYSSWSKLYNWILVRFDTFDSIFSGDYSSIITQKFAEKDQNR